MARSKSLLLVLSGLLLGTLVTASNRALAVGTELDSGARVVPYNGVLDLNGTTYNGTVDIRVSITTNVASCTFTEDHAGVTVYGGRFAINIGTGKTNNVTNTGVNSCIFGVTDVYVGLAVKAPTSTSWTTLTGRQRIRPVPFAYWSAEGSDFRIDGSMEVRGSDLKLGTSDGRTGSDANQYALSHLSTGDQLMLNYGSGFSGGIKFQGPNALEGGNTLSGGNTLLGGTTIGDSKPASGKAQLQLFNNDGGGLDDFNDYQLLLYKETTPAGSYGLGTSASTLWLNSPSNIDLRSNNTTRIQAHSTGATVTGNLKVTGNIDVDGTFLTMSGLYSDGQNNTAGDTPVDLGTTTNRMCFLTKVSMEDVDGVGEWAECVVYISGNNWYLSAKLGTTPDADVNCEARCLSWN